MSGIKRVRSQGERTVAERQNSKAKKKGDQTVHQFFSWSGGRWYICAPLSRALQRDASQHRKLGVKAPLFASAACEVAPHVMLILVASPGFEDFVLIDGA